jgi:hypothetical protein
MENTPGTDFFLRLRIKKADYDKLKAVAKSEDRTMANVIRRALRSYYAMSDGPR